LTNINLEVGFPELALICGSAVFIFGGLSMGISLCALGTIAAISRTGLRAQKQQRAEEDRKALIKEIHDAPGELAESLISIFSKAVAKKTVH